MAVDHVAKRRGLLSMGRPWLARPPLLGGGVDLADRKMGVLRYAGFVFAVPAFVVYSARRLAGDNYGGRKL